MNKFIIVALFASMACVVVADNAEDAHAYIVKQASDIDEHGIYNYNYETSNGISVQEKGEGGHYANGGFEYHSPEGEHIQLSYLADENGFQPTGSHIPIAPEIPHEILKALEYIRTHPQYDEQNHH